MRDLILLRGAPGSGKSTFVKEHHLEPYTVSSDQVRLMFSAPEIDALTGEPHISQRNENAVWEFIYQIVELRMKTGQFIVLDAQNLHPARWLKLAEKYRYRVYVKQMEATLEECLERNAKRPVLNRVPEHVIMASNWKLDNNELSSKVKPVTEDIANGDIQPFDANGYEHVWICGDVHGCYVPLKAFYDYTGGFPEKDLIIFVGDYVDRGIQNKETLELLIEQRHKKNVVFLEGNHIWETLFANDRVDEIKSHEFMLNTLPQIETIDKKHLREWASRWGQFCYFTFHGKCYLVTHAGIGYMPEHLLYVPTKMFTRGGAYEEDVDRAWCEKGYGPNLIQVHGHRNWYQYAIDETETSINLCSAVEFGEPLRVYGVDAEDTYYLTFDNPVHRAGMSLRRRADLLEGKATATPQEVAELLVYNLRMAKGVEEKQLKNGVSSFNFSRDIFYSMAWDDLNKIARGLFVDTIHWKILARGFEKFFHANEHNGLFNSKEWLKENLKFPVKAWKKYNGFLFMTSWNPYTNEIFYASKSTTEGPHVDIGKKVLQEYFDKNPVDAKKIIDYMKANDVTILWEICSHEDPHPIWEWEHGDKAVCLAIVKNTVKFETIPDQEFQNLVYECWESVPTTEVENIFNSWEELEPCIDSGIYAPVHEPTEGWVLVDANGYRFKGKTAYYDAWKRLRNIKEALQEHPEIEIHWDKWDETAWEVIRFMKLYKPELLKEYSIVFIRGQWLATSHKDYPYDMTKQQLQERIRPS